MKEVVIVSAARTPFGKCGGGLKALKAAGAENRRQALVRDLSLNPAPSVRKGNRLHR